MKIQVLPLSGKMKLIKLSQRVGQVNQQRGQHDGDISPDGFKVQQRLKKQSTKQASSWLDSACPGLIRPIDKDLPFDLSIIKDPMLDLMAEEWNILYVTGETREQNGPHEDRASEQGLKMGPCDFKVELVRPTQWVVQPPRDSRPLLALTNVFYLFYYILIISIMLC